MTDRSLYLLGPTGTRIDLVTDVDDTYSLMSGTMGLGSPPVINRFAEGVANGNSHRGKKYGARPLDLPVFIQGDSRADLQTQVRALQKLVDVPVGPKPKLVAEFNDGTILELPFVYISGLEGDGPQTTRNRTTVPLSLLCPEPFWTARNALSFAFENSGSATPLLDDLAGLPVASSLIGGSAVINNPGDVEADLTVLVNGPSSGNTTVLINGVGWVFTTALLSTETITITRTPTAIKVTDQTGANRYGNLAAAAKFPQLPPGDSTVSVTMVGATSASSVRGNWKPRYKGIV